MRQYLTSSPGPRHTADNDTDAVMRRGEGRTADLNIRYKVWATMTLKISKSGSVMQWEGEDSRVVRIIHFLVLFLCLWLSTHLLFQRSDLDVTLTSQLSKLSASAR